MGKNEPLFIYRIHFSLFFPQKKIRTSLRFRRTPSPLFEFSSILSLPNIRVLNLFNTNVTDAMLKSLSTSPMAAHLTALELSFSEVSNESLPLVWRNFPQ